MGQLEQLTSSPPASPGETAEINSKQLLTTVHTLPEPASSCSQSTAVQLNCACAAFCLVLFLNNCRPQPSWGNLSNSHPPHQLAPGKQQQYTPSSCWLLCTLQVAAGASSVLLSTNCCAADCAYAAFCCCLIHLQASTIMGQLEQFTSPPTSPGAAAEIDPQQLLAAVHTSSCYLSLLAPCSQPTAVQPTVHMLLSAAF
jgi:hypothetical protein